MRIDLKKKYLLAAAVLVLSAALSLGWGLGTGEGAQLVLRELRIPRLILGIAVGAGLSLAGLVLQTVLTNPLAEPYTLGIASGAALGAALASTVRLQLDFLGLNAGAVLGACAVIFLLLRLVGRGVRGQEPIILLGVMVSLTAASLLSVWMALADPVGVQSLNFWLLGDLSRAGLGPSLALLMLVLVIAFYFFVFSRNLDAFLFGEDQVESFGVSLARTQQLSILLVSIIVGFCVSAAGIIGFIGLVVPHGVRRWVRVQRHYHLIPFTLLTGSILLVVSDLLARKIADPRELPVGAVTALLGAPVLMALFLSGKKGEVE
jgi:iron complex transport system permease protein